MKKFSRYLAAIMFTALLGAMLVGCSGQQASSGAAARSQAGSASASAASAGPETLTPDQLIAELNSSSESDKYKSVTMKMDGTMTIDQSAMAASGSAAAASGSAASSQAMSIPMDILAKCDTSDGTVKMSMDMNTIGQQMKLYINGNDAVMVIGDQVIGATLEELGMGQYSSIESIMQSSTGSLDKLKDMIKTAEKTTEGDVSVYTVTMDPEKLVNASDAVNTLGQLGGSLDISGYTFVYRVGSDGLLQSMDMDMQGKGFSYVMNAKLSDYNATTVDPAPEPNTTYSEMVNSIANSTADATATQGDAAAASDTATDKAA